MNDNTTNKPPITEHNVVELWTDWFESNGIEPSDFTDEDRKRLAAHRSNYLNKLQLAETEMQRAIALCTSQFWLSVSKLCDEINSRKGANNDH